MSKGSARNGIETEGFQSSNQWKLLHQKLAGITEEEEEFGEDNGYSTVVLIRFLWFQTISKLSDLLNAKKSFLEFDISFINEEISLPNEMSGALWNPPLPEFNFMALENIVPKRHLCMFGLTYVDIRSPTVLYEISWIFRTYSVWLMYKYVWRMKHVIIQWAFISLCFLHEKSGLRIHTEPRL